MQSMTGYGKETSRQGDWEMTVELRAVNHRFLDLSMRLGRGLTFLEETIRKTLAPLCRGHVDVQLTLRRISGSDSDVTVDATLAAAYMQAANTLQAATGAANDLTVSRLMQLDGVTTVTECALDEDALTAQCREVTALAMQHLTDMRIREGAHLRDDLQVHLDAAAARGSRLRRVPRRWWRNTGCAWPNGWRVCRLNPLIRRGWHRRLR